MRVIITGVDSSVAAAALFVAGEGAASAGDVTFCVEGTGGRQVAQGPYRAAASANGIKSFDGANDRHVSR